MLVRVLKHKSGVELNWYVHGPLSLSTGDGSHPSDLNSRAAGSCRVFLIFFKLMSSHPCFPSTSPPYCSFCKDFWFFLFCFFLVDIFFSANDRSGCCVPPCLRLLALAAFWEKPSFALRSRQLAAEFILFYWREGVRHPLSSIPPFLSNRRPAKPPSPPAVPSRLPSNRFDFP